METGQLLHFEPQELSFPVELNTQLSSSLRLFNRTNDHVFFKLLTASPKRYGVRPRIGLLSPGSDCEITVTTRVTREAPVNLRCKDQFLVRTVVAGPGATAEDAQAMFNRESGHVFHECKLRVVYVSPQPRGVLVPDVDETTVYTSVASTPDNANFSFRSSVSENANPNPPEVLSSDIFTNENENPNPREVRSPVISTPENPNPNPPEVVISDISTNENENPSPNLNPPEDVSSDISTNENENPNPNLNPPEVVSSDKEPDADVIQVNTGKLLHVEPLELQCPSKLNEENRCSLQLSNLTESHVAFLVKSASSKYFAHPSVGIILPRSTCEIAVRMQDESSVQTDAQSEDKFLIHSFVAIPAAIEENITPEMFNRGGSTVEECDVQIVHIKPQENIAKIRAELIVMGLIVCILAIVCWYLMKKTLFLIWSLTFLIINLVMKMVKKLVSDSVEDLVVKVLLYACMHLGQRIYVNWSRLKTVTMRLG